jgi:hypothetical protein
VPNLTIGYFRIRVKIVAVGLHMDVAITPHLTNLIYDALLKSFWRRQALRKYLRSCGISENFLATWAEEESKRDLLDKLFKSLQNNPKKSQMLLYIAENLSEQTTFPDLEGWEDSPQKIRDASQAVRQLKSHLQKLKEEKVNEEERRKARKAAQERIAEVARARTDLQKLSERLNELAKNLGTQGAGYKFQDWFYDLLDYSEIISRRPYNHGGRQIDGSFTLSGTTYLVELKFTREQADSPDIDTFLKKVNDKADNTMGVVVSMSGYSSIAIQEASGRKTPLLLLDAQHIYHVLSSQMSFSEVIDRIRRHASQTGEAFLSVSNFHLD